MNKRCNLKSDRWMPEFYTVNLYLATEATSGLKAEQGSCVSSHCAVSFRLLFVTFSQIKMSTSGRNWIPPRSPVIKIHFPSVSHRAERSQSPKTV